MTKKETIRNAIKTYTTYTMTKTNGDTAKPNKVLEVITRDYIHAHGITSLADVKPRAINRMDARCHGKVVEIKSGSGAVAYAEKDGMGGYIDPFTKADCIAENVLAGVRLVVWYPWAGVALAGDTFRMGWVFTREQFIDTLTAIGKNGLASSLKISKNGGQINIQTITAKMEERLTELLENFPTVEEYQDW